MITIEKQKDKAKRIGDLECPDTFEYEGIYYLVAEGYDEEEDDGEFLYIDLRTGCRKSFPNQDCLVQPVDLVARLVVTDA